MSSHYKKGSVEPIELIIGQDMGFLEGNIVKYVTRYKYKDGIKDLEKAKYYLDKLLEKAAVEFTDSQIKPLTNE